MKRKRQVFGSVILALALLLPLTPVRVYAGSCPAPGSAPPPPVARYTMYDDVGTAFKDFLAQTAGAFSLGQLNRLGENMLSNGLDWNIGGGRTLDSKIPARIFGSLDKAFNIASVVKDLSSYTESSKHKHASLEFLDNCFRGWSIGLSIQKQVPYAGEIGGFIRDMFGGQSLADFFNGINKGDNAFLDTMDSLVNSMNLSVQDFYFLVDAMWIDFYNWLMEMVGPGQDGEVQVEKPNIYLYSEIPTQMRVTFTRPELLLTSLPRYDPGGDGWQVTVQEDGILLSGGEEYGFLFYESAASPLDFQTREGFVIKAGDRARQFEEILDAYGFNQAEKDDFTAYWVRRLDPNQDYVMYPQDTERLDAVMPLNVCPAPDHVFRLWFGFRAMEEIPEPPETAPIERGGLTVVEWGGSVLNE